ncbi:class I SAM-dependent methyltransferase [Methanococcoides sp. FTZ1]|uniref:class I SAM-dependent methyltransferase n=1 Tax=Methanococcoides sp. FTZ1 TaxID=3439061 RepID=UPI003F8754A1
MSTKGNEFGTIYGGKNYDIFATLLGFGHSFYEKAADEMPIEKGMKVLDLGCGTASLDIEIEERMEHTGKVFGIDLSKNQLEYAHSKTKQIADEISLYKGTMDELPFKDETFDMVVTSVAFCETNAEVRRSAIKEASRVLVKGGHFVIIDCAKPRFSLTSVMMLPFFMFKTNDDNWNNTYVDICSENSMTLEKEDYLKSYIRFQIFKKEK